MDLSPLLPAVPPPTFTLTRPEGRSSSSWTTTSRSVPGTRKRRIRAETARPDSFMYVWGTASTTS